ncbi:probable mfs-multidrug-resistance transporter [Cephalotrichum gorgonifer]|uniref:Probable mfs-multidrug-resistance transporter n=1 Tax=Cephalotrichum gorgonifer TaxID=2041049 RepID=A0AAE8SWI3_9PEZI|nr:probable mfs-multidrug-resistance transporter [Cephalotrichum gorgonifer]
MADPMESNRAETDIPYLRMVFDQAGVTPQVATFEYPGKGTAEDPYVITWLPNDPRSPQNLRPVTKWTITLITAFNTLAVSLMSSAYSGGIREIIAEFHISRIVSILGVSLFVLGFAIGPLLWAPLSELFGRQSLFFVTYGALTAFTAGCCGAQNIETLLILRFFAGAFGSSPLTNSGGVIADMFSASERGTATAIFAAAPFLGPVIGPIAGGFLGAGAGWRWVMGFQAIFSGFCWMLGTFAVPETYAPVLLRKRAEKLSKLTGKHYESAIDHAQGKISLAGSFKIALSRPWKLLFTEPIVFLLSLYMAIVYGTLYMLFAAFPIVFQQGRGWSSGIGGLAFLGIMVGMFCALAYTFIDNRRYVRVVKENGGMAPPETRLPPTMVAAVFLPIGLFWFAWTNAPSLHWMIPIASGVPFGFGMVLMFLSIMNYLIDSYTIFAASVLAANSVIRSLFGAAFPLFTGDMYANLGIHWASSIPAFLALACVPFPFLFYKYGAAIREKCKYAAQSAAFMRRMQAQAMAQAAGAGAKGQEKVGDEDKPEAPRDVEGKDKELDESRGADTASLASAKTETGDPSPMATGLARVDTRASTAHSLYEGNPYDVDRVNTRQSFA